MRVNTPHELGLLVRERRQDLRLSQQELADRVGVSRPWLVSVESGHSRAELGKVLSLLAELGLSLDLDLGDEHGVESGTVDLDALLAGHDAVQRSRIRRE